MSVLILGFTMVIAVLVMGTVAVTSVQLCRMRLLDAADGAALDAADSLDVRSYETGLTGAVAVSTATVSQTAVSYLAARPRPVGMRSWHVAPGTGSPDGQTAVVRLTGQADLPLVGGVLSRFGGSLSITVESRARAVLR
ncbi:pilus assembly protein TadG-related protein [Pedococcus sp. 5OH_020]|uniref:pilus assembly protein TadG-related protein n=1 Tax=Pedococcus sp. 5OH_020 TaxID=2989814 RepID=UPI0022E9CBCF|nr:pilus assembly protein TadG-related protein [Pedococcus sp. 5OH_020]